MSAAPHKVEGIGNSVRGKWGRVIDAGLCDMRVRFPGHKEHCFHAGNFVEIQRVVATRYEKVLID